jgi:hypothetical protein
LPRLVRVSVNLTSLAACRELHDDVRVTLLHRTRNAQGCEWQVVASKEEIRYVESLHCRAHVCGVHRVEKGHGRAHNLCAGSSYQLYQE